MQVDQLVQMWQEAITETVTNHIPKEDPRYGRCHKTLNAVVSSSLSIRATDCARTKHHLLMGCSLVVLRESFC